MKLKALTAGVALAMMCSSAAQALTLNVVDSLTTAEPFGVGFNGSNIFFGTGERGDQVHFINQNAPGMPLTGAPLTLSGPGTGGALAWDGTHIVSADIRTHLVYFNMDGSISSVTFVSAPIFGPVNAGLVDGFDFDHNEVWYSPAVGGAPGTGAVYRLDTKGALLGPNPVLPLTGNFSGVERVDVGGRSFLVVVSNAAAPPRMCVTTLSGAFNPAADCAALPDAHYTDLAFDGRFLYAADTSGNRLDKIDLADGAGSILVSRASGAVPEPATVMLLAGGLAALVAIRRKPLQRRSA